GTTATLSLLRPAAAERPVQLDRREKLVSLCRCQVQLGGEELALVVEDLEVTGHPAVVTNLGERGRAPQHLDELLLLLTRRESLPVADERVGALSHGQLHALLIAEHGLRGPGFRGVDAGTHTTGVEDRYRHGGTDPEDPHGPEGHAVRDAARHRDVAEQEHP